MIWNAKLSLEAEVTKAHHTFHWKLWSQVFVYRQSEIDHIFPNLHAPLPFSVPYWINVIYLMLYLPRAGRHLPITWNLLLLFSCSVVSDSFWPHGLQHARLPCPSPSPGVCSNSRSSSWWYHSTISSSVAPFSSQGKGENGITMNIEFCMDQCIVHGRHLTQVSSPRYRPKGWSFYRCWSRNSNLSPYVWLEENFIISTISNWNLGCLLTACMSNKPQ